MNRIRRIHMVARGTLAFAWIWHGLVPKLIRRHPDEITPLIGMGTDEETAWFIVTISGLAEIVFGLLLFFLRRARRPLWLTMIAMSGLLLGVLATAPELIGGAFNPVTLNVLMIAIAAIALLSIDDDRKDEGEIPLRDSE